jgi:hypothetical protein
MATKMACSRTLSELPYNFGARCVIARSIAVLEAVLAGFFGAMSAAINLATSFNAVTNYLAITVGTGRCQHVNRAFEAVKGPSLSGRDNLE